MKEGPLKQRKRGLAAVAAAAGARVVFCVIHTDTETEHGRGRARPVLRVRWVGGSVGRSPYVIRTSLGCLTAPSSRPRPACRQRHLPGKEDAKQESNQLP